MAWSWMLLSSQPLDPEVDTKNSQVIQWDVFLVPVVPTFHATEME